MLEVERQQASSSGIPGSTILVVVGACLLGGLAIGSSGPIFVIYIGPGIFAGPTMGGLALLLAVAAAALSGLGGFLALLVARGAAVLGAVFVLSVSLAAGIVLGVWAGSSSHVGGWALRPTPAPTPTWSFAPRPVVYQANGEVTLRLPGVPGFAQPQLESFGDGVFSHWCYSDPGAKTTSTIDALDVGTLDGETVQLELRLTDPAGQFAQWSVAIPRVSITVADARGQVSDRWVGPATVVEPGTSSGRLTFEALPAEGGGQRGSQPATLSGEVAWRCGIWQSPYR